MTAAAATSATRPTFAVAAVLLASLLASFDTRILSITLPDVRAGLGLDFDEGAWLQTAATAPQLLVAPCVAWLAATFGARRILFWPSLTYTAVAVTLPYAHDATVVLALHLARGFLLGLFIPATLMVIFRNLNPKWWIPALAIYVARLPLSSSIGEWLGGTPVEMFGWSFPYWQDVVVAPLIALLAVLGFPKEKANIGLLEGADWGGMLLLGCGLAALYAGLDQGNRLNWWESGTVVGLVIVGLVLLAGFLLNEAMVPKPWASLSVLANRNATGGLLIICAYIVASIATSSLVPNFLTTIAGFRPEQQARQILVMSAVPALLGTMIGAAMVKRVDLRVLMIVGFATMGISSWLAVRVTSVWTDENFAIVYALSSFGQGLTFFAALLFTIANADRTRAVSFSAYVQVFRLDGAELAASLVTTFVRVREQIHSNDLVQHVTAQTAVSQNTLRALGATFLTKAGGGPDDSSARAASTVAGLVRREANVLSYADAFAVTFWACVIGLLLVAAVTRAPSGPLAK